MNQPQELRRRIDNCQFVDETAYVAELCERSGLSDATRQAISQSAETLVADIRGHSDPALMETFLAEYGLSSDEGVALMCLAEALLRVPDDATVDALIHDKIAAADWGRHLGQSSSSLVNASTWALMLTGKIIEDEPDGMVGAIRGLVKKLGEPIIRTAVNQAIRELGNQFVLGSSIEQAIDNSANAIEQGFGYSYDMLGEAALTDADARQYHLSYSKAIAALGSHCNTDQVASNPGISVKLSALFPRYEFRQRERVMIDLVARTRSLAMLARSANMGFNIDAEEADRLELSLDVIEQVLCEPSLAGWHGFGVVVQAYSPRAMAVINWLYAVAEKHDRKLMVRLVKGAYWDSEIKQAQVSGCDGYPVFTRKSHTDVSYMACAKRLLQLTDRIYPQFATHNAHTVTAVLRMARDCHDKHFQQQFEFQRLHGMGEALHKLVMEQNQTRCRIYAPVGRHKQLLAYLVRRLLENGANSSFVNQIVDESIAPATIAADPFATVNDNSAASALPAPSDLFPTRRNSRGYDFSHPPTLDGLLQQRQQFLSAHWKAGEDSATQPIHNPARLDDVVGYYSVADEQAIEQAWQSAQAAFNAWQDRNVSERSSILHIASDLYESHTEELCAVLCREAGKTLDDAIAEIREAVDFLRYYAQRAETLQQNKKLAARGTFVCISPWNFPLAIFTGQIAAALATGNCVLAKPAEQTPLIAARAVQLLHEAGVPQQVLQLLPGPGSRVGSALVSDARLAGVCFTGSTATASLINRSMAKQCRVDAPLIAETGGLNAMIVDSTALPEQAVGAIIESAFQSAGQRCSALRILYVQSDVRAVVQEMLIGAMRELDYCDPWQLKSDLGPLIDQQAKSDIAEYCRSQRVLFQTAPLFALQDEIANGHFMPPTLIEVNGIADLTHEVFGPVLHLAEFEAHQFEQVINDINHSGYGLTFGLQTRVDERVQDVLDQVDAGNLYINRNQIGAIVESQPFGGKGLSGTGPKAGGPHYLLRFLHDRKTSDSPAALNFANTEHSPDALAAELKIDHPIADLLRAPPAVLKDISSATGIDTGCAQRALNYACEHYHETVDLPGPTGESNRLGMQASGLIVCLHTGDDEHWQAQALQSLALGNKVLAIGPKAVKLVSYCQRLWGEQRIAAMDTVPDIQSLAAMSKLSGVCVQPSIHEHSAMRELRIALAERDGPIVPLLTDLFDISQLVSEKTLCIDTTAAGGNASLLAEAT